MEFKTCTKCKEVKRFDEFYRRNEKKYHAQCKACAKLYAQTHWKDDPEARSRKIHLATARVRALEELARRHEGEFREIYNRYKEP